jgi:hypothetical protein
LGAQAACCLRIAALQQASAGSSRQACGRREQQPSGKQESAVRLAGRLIGWELPPAAALANTQAAALANTSPGASPTCISTPLRTLPLRFRFAKSQPRMSTIASVMPPPLASWLKVARVSAGSNAMRACVAWWAWTWTGGKSNKQRQWQGGVDTGEGAVAIRGAEGARGLAEIA